MVGFSLIYRSDWFGEYGNVFPVADVNLSVFHYCVYLKGSRTSYVIKVIDKS